MSALVRVCLCGPDGGPTAGGASAWLRAVAEVLHAGPNVEVTIPQLGGPPHGPEPGEALDVIEGLDRERRFDHIVVRSLPYCRAAVGRPSLAPRLWSAEVLDPERDLEDPNHLADLAAIAEGSAWVVVGSEELRALLEALIPAARGRTIVLCPAVASAGASPRLPAPRRERLIHASSLRAGPAATLQALADELRRDLPALELRALGAWDSAAAATTLAEGGIGLCPWEDQLGSRSDEFVVAPALLEFGAAGLPVVAGRTAAHERVLGDDYPLLVRQPSELLPLVRAVLADVGLYERAARLAIAAAERHTYPRVHAAIAPFLEGRATADLHTYDRPKLPEARYNLGMLDPGDEDMAQAYGLLGDLRRIGGGWRLQVGRSAATDPEPGRDPATATLRKPPDRLRDVVSTRTVHDERNWWRTIGIALVRSAGSPHTARARASGAVTFDLEHVTLRSIRELADEASWRRASEHARASILSMHRPEAA